ALALTLTADRVALRHSARNARRATRGGEGGCLNNATIRANIAVTPPRIDGAIDAKDFDGNLDRAGDGAGLACAAGSAGERPVQVGRRRPQGPERGHEKETRGRPIQGRDRAAARQEIRSVAEYALRGRAQRAASA